MNPLGAETLLPELRRLIFHQRDQRTNHERRSAPHHRRQLVTERLPCPGRHDEEYVLPGRSRLADGFLMRTESVEAEPRLQNLNQFRRRRRARRELGRPPESLRRFVNLRRRGVACCRRC